GASPPWRSRDRPHRYQRLPYEDLEPLLPAGWVSSWGDLGQKGFHTQVTTVFARGEPKKTRPDTRLKFLITYGLGTSVWFAAQLKTRREEKCSGLSESRSGAGSRRVRSKRELAPAVASIYPLGFRAQ